MYLLEAGVKWKEKQERIAAKKARIDQQKLEKEHAGQSPEKRKETEDLDGRMRPNPNPNSNPNPNWRI